MTGCDWREPIMVAYIEDTTYGKRKIDEGGINIVSFDYDDDSGFHCCQDEIFILFIQAGTTKEAEAEGLRLSLLRQAQRLRCGADSALGALRKEARRRQPPRRQEVRQECKEEGVRCVVCGARSQVEVKSYSEVGGGLRLRPRLVFLCSSSKYLSESACHLFVFSYFGQPYITRHTYPPMLP